MKDETLLRVSVTWGSPVCEGAPSQKKKKNTGLLLGRVVVRIRRNTALKVLCPGPGIHSKHSAKGVLCCYWLLSQARVIAIAQHLCWHFERCPGILQICRTVHRQ